MKIKELLPLKVYPFTLRTITVITLAVPILRLFKVIFVLSISAG